MKKTIPLLFLIGLALGLSFENFASSANVFKSTSLAYVELKLERFPTGSVQRNVRTDTSADTSVNTSSKSQFIFVSSKPTPSSVNTTSQPNHSVDNLTTLEGTDQSIAALEEKPLMLIGLLLFGIILLVGMIWLMDRRRSSVESVSESSQKD
jgi:hypothetical protein